MWAGFDHGSLNDPHQATVNLANLTQQIEQADTLIQFVGKFGISADKSCHTESEHNLCFCVLTLGRYIITIA